MIKRLKIEFNRHILIRLAFVFYCVIQLFAAYKIRIEINGIEYWGRMINIAAVVFTVCMLTILPKHIMPKADIINLLFALILFWITTAFTSFIINDKVLDVHLLIVAMSILTLIVNFVLKDLNFMVGVSILFLVLHCIVSLYFIPQGKGVDFNYTKGIFGSFLDFRLHGTQWEANPMGGVAAVTAIAGAAASNIFIVIIGVITCILTQSKTAMLGMIVSFFVLFYSNLRIKKAMKIVIIACFGIICALLLFSIFYETFGTFSGRTLEWAFFYQRWKQSIVSILFGVRNTQLGSYYFVENQFLQSLFKNGLVGLVSFCYLIVVMYKTTYKVFKNGYKLPFVLFLLILIRCLMESYFASLETNDLYFVLLLLSIRKGIMQPYAVNEFNRTTNR